MLLTVVGQLPDEIILVDGVRGEVAAGVDEGGQRARGEALDALHGGGGRVGAEAVEAPVAAGLPAGQLVQDGQLVLVGPRAALGRVEAGEVELERVDEDQHGPREAPRVPARRRRRRRRRPLRRQVPAGAAVEQLHAHEQEAAGEEAEARHEEEGGPGQEEQHRRPPHRLRPLGFAAAWSSGRAQAQAQAQGRLPTSLPDAACPAGRPGPEASAASAPTLPSGVKDETNEEGRRRREAAPPPGVVDQARRAWKEGRSRALLPLARGGEGGEV